MKKNSGILITIVCIVVIGIFTTYSTSKFVVRNETKPETQVETQAVLTEEIKVLETEREVPPEEVAADSEMQNPIEISPIETTASLQTETAAEEAAAEHVPELAENRENPAVNRLLELDMQIKKRREEETDTTSYGLKTAAESELKIWNSELDTLYNRILELLPQEERENYVQQERDWMKERDALAVEAAQKSNSGSLESLEYTVSLAESTRKRAYDLAENYASFLSIP